MSSAAAPAKKSSPNAVPGETGTYRRGQQLQKKRLRDHVEKERHLAFYDRGPGPAGYILPPLVGKRHHDVRHPIEPEYTMRPYLQSSFQMQGLVGPGAGYYKIQDNVTHHGVCYPIEQSFGTRAAPRTDAEKNTVGPGSHNLPDPDVYLFRTGKCLIFPYRPFRSGLYTDALYILDSMIGPKVMLRTAAQEVSMKGNRKDEKLLESDAPAPGTYNIVEPERNPAWTMLGRHPDLSDQLNKVGPKYSLENVKDGPRAPAWKFGQKHNDFTGILRTKCDIVDYKNLDRLY